MCPNGEYGGKNHARGHEDTTIEEGERKFTPVQSTFDDGDDTDPKVATKGRNKSGIGPVGIVVVMSKAMASRRIGNIDTAASGHFQRAMAQMKSI